MVQNGYSSGATCSYSFLRVFRKKSGKTYAHMKKLRNLFSFSFGRGLWNSFWVTSRISASNLATEVRVGSIDTEWTTEHTCFDGIPTECVVRLHEALTRFHWDNPCIMKTYSLLEKTSFHTLVVCGFVAGQCILSGTVGRFYYTSISSLLLRAPFWYIFLISVALSPVRWGSMMHVQHDPRRKWREGGKTTQDNLRMSMWEL